VLVAGVTTHRVLYLKWMRNRQKMIIGVSESAASKPCPIVSHNRAGHQGDNEISLGTLQITN